MTLNGWGLVVLAAIVVGIFVESWRQRRALGRPSGRPHLLGVGALELQRHLEPERKVEIVLQEARREEHTEPGHRPGRAGEPGGDDSDDRENLARLHDR